METILMFGPCAAAILQQEPSLLNASHMVMTWLKSRQRTGLQPTLLSALAIAMLEIILQSCASFEAESEAGEEELDFVP
jgi:hypothetical protein